MALIHQFDYAKPKSLDETFALLSRHDDAMLLAGGTDLVDMIRDGAVRPDIVVDIKGLDTLNGITFENNTLSVSANTTFSDLIASKLIAEKYPVIIELAKTVASVGIRNRATVIGNICSSVPCMDSGPLLTSYDAVIQTAGPNGKRSIPAGQWFIAPRKTSIQKGELVTGVSIPHPKVKHAGCWVKLGRYAGEDLAQVSVLILALADGTFRISFGAVAPVPVRAKRLEAILNGQKITPSLIEEAAQLIEKEITPITDVRASKEYRMHMAKVMFERGMKAAMSRLNGGGPSYCTSVI